MSSGATCRLRVSNSYFAQCFCQLFSKAFAFGLLSTFPAKPMDMNYSRTANIVTADEQIGAGTHTYHICGYKILSEESYVRPGYGRTTHGWQLMRHASLQQISIRGAPNSRSPHIWCRVAVSTCPPPPMVWSPKPEALNPKP